MKIQMTEKRVRIAMAVALWCVFTFVLWITAPDHGSRNDFWGMLAMCSFLAAAGGIGFLLFKGAQWLWFKAGDFADQLNDKQGIERDRDTRDRNNRRTW